MVTLFSFLFILIILVVSIVIHEYGHMKAALKCGISCPLFCIGFGKPVITRKGKNGVTYGLSPLLFGGYCSIPDEELAEASYKDFVKVLFAGVKNNFIACFVSLYIGISCLLRTINPVTVIKGAIGFICNFAGSIGTIMHSMVDFKGMVETDTIGAISTTGNIIASYPVLNMIAAVLLLFAVFNLMVGLFNLLPIPSIDGGQIVTRTIQEIYKKITKKEISKKVVFYINQVFFGGLMVYQVVVLVLVFIGSLIN